MTHALRIAIVHYHLRPGGVTRIIEQTAAVLAANGVQVAVLSGAPPANPWPVDGVPVVVVEGLNYAEGRSVDPAALVARLRGAATEALGGPPAIWHVHNHTLGRNLGVTLAVRQLAEAGERLLLQIHDFPEDGRPGNYAELLQELAAGDPGRLYAQLYPAAAQVHYAVLNQRDFGFMRGAGAGERELHLLANPVSTPARVSDGGQGVQADGGGRMFLYPTRALRRKNLGELLLWAALGRPGDRFATTLAPTSAADRVVYDAWKSLAHTLQLPVEFEVGLRPGASFAGLVGAAHAIVTTSVAEGFGLAFLEPWLSGRPLVGRNVREITADFAGAGVVLDALYDRLLVPLDWVGRDRLARVVGVGMAQRAEAYGRQGGRADVERALASAIDGECVDFGRLDEDAQADVIRRMVVEPALRDHVRPASLEPAMVAMQARMDANRAAVAANFSLEAYGARLLAIYGALAAVTPEPVQGLQGGALLDAFLAPERFCLLRT